MGSASSARLENYGKHFWILLGVNQCKLEQQTLYYLLSTVDDECLSVIYNQHKLTFQADLQKAIKASL